MSAKKTLVIVHPHFTIPGGAGKFILEIGKRLCSKMNIVVIAQKVNPEYIKNYPEITFEDIGGPVTSSFKFWFLLPIWRKKTFKVIDKYRRSGEIQILCNVFPANWVTLPYKRLHPEIKMFWFCQEPSAFIHIKKWRDAIPSLFKRTIANLLAPIFAKYDKSLIKYADKIFSNSKFTQGKAKEIYGTETTVIYPGIDIDKYDPIPYEKKENYVLTVGRLTKFKNIDVLVNAFSKLKNKKLSLKIIGDGEEKESLIQLAKSLGIEDRVAVISELTDKEVADSYAKAKLFVLCSKEEPFGMVPVEALASGTAAIADNSGGPKEIIQDQRSGLLINNQNPINLADAIDELFESEEILEKYSKNARASVVDVFTWDISAEKMAEVLSA